MQEFSSVTASSYDADSLAPLLTEKSADGWDVISIVSAGTNIVAYLSREASSGGGEDTGEIDASAYTGAGTDLALAEEAIAEEIVEDEVAKAEIDAAIDAEVASDVEALAEIAAIEDAIQVPSDPTPIAAAAPPETPAETAAPATDTAVEEPAGWGAAPAEETSVDELAAQVSEPEPEPEPVVAAVAEPEPVAEQAPAAAESTVPAGWYADPSGRYELRYWDGTAWTEHVSRAGQQFTDPPVA